MILARSDKNKGFRAKSILLFWVFFFCPYILSQSNEEVFRESQFDFNLPGSRANAMGGAFIGVADDATASFTNPAGLAFLNETALTFEYRSQSFDARTGEISGRFNSIFNVDEIKLDRAGFFSLNFRLGSWYLGVYQFDYLEEFQTRKFESKSIENNLVTFGERDLTLNLRGTTRGIGLARRLGNWKLGASLNHMTFQGDTNYIRNRVIINPAIVQNYHSQIDDEDQAWGLTLGVLHEWRERFSWGLVWREHPRFKLKEHIKETLNQRSVFDETLSVPFVVPDVFGIGGRYRVRPELSVLLDWQKIFYSQIIENGFLIVEGQDEVSENYQIKDVDELHFGVEWLIPGENSVWAVRGGYYRNPRHTVTYQGNNEVIADRFASTGLRDEDHTTMGFGWVYKNRFEFDLAANIWGAGKEITASFIWRRK